MLCCARLGACLRVVVVTLCRVWGCGLCGFALCCSVCCRGVFLGGCVRSGILRGGGVGLSLDCLALWVGFMCFVGSLFVG